MAEAYVGMADIEAKIAATSSSFAEYTMRLTGVKAGVEYANTYFKQAAAPAPTPTHPRVLSGKDLRSL